MNWYFFILGCTFMGLSASNPVYIGAGTMFMVMAFIWPDDEDEEDEE